MNLGLTEDHLEIVKGRESLLFERKGAHSDEEVNFQALLWWAVDFGSVVQVERILAGGANPNIVFPPGYTPLGRAMYSFRGQDRVEVVRLILAAQADPRVPSEREMPLLIASKVGPSEVARMVLAALLKSGKPSAADLNTALLQAVGRGDATLVEELLKAGASVNHRETIRDLFTSTPVSSLMRASFYGEPKTIQILLESGADANLKDAEGHTALDYAAVDAERCSKAISLLKKAGAVSGVPFPRDDDDATQGFAEAAKQPAFKNAVERIRQLTGLASKSLNGINGKIPGGHAFLFDENASKTFVERGPTEYVAVGDRARQFVEQNHAEMLKHGAYLFYTYTNGPAVAILPTTDVYRVIAALETEGPDADVHYEDLIAWLRKLEKGQPFVLTGVGTDFLEGRFTTPIKDPAALVKRINKICPNEGESAVAEREQIERLRKTNKLFLWWD